jgi:DNA-dependent RNA polymerase auxiliary subunit epsilon
VLSLVPTISERTVEDEKTGKLTLFRMDFSATIVTADEGEKQVIIEMQKAHLLDDIYRFRRYLGSEYATSKLPIISIYILGFNLSVDSPAFSSRPDYIDLLTKEKLSVNDAFVGLLTHNAYFVQTLRIKPKYNTRLEKLLTIFEQANFVGTSSTTKFYDPEVDDPELREITNILQYVAGDREIREKLEKEEYYLQFIEDNYGDRDRKLAESIRANFKLNVVIAEKDEVIAEKDEVIAEKDEALAEKDEALAVNYKKIRDIAYTLKFDGMQIEKIAILTGLSISEIEAL